MAEKMDKENKTCYKCNECGNVLFEVDNKKGKKELTDKKLEKYFYYDDQMYYKCPHCDTSHEVESIVDKGLLNRIKGVPFG